ncbi:Rpn family recombination-promoting nuclease/putative transposase [uncultured Thiohalocapsa sp.]|uniref:Rpn family recombination-promoting nuclease/putative transposase n=1 Tax=uncultured Thiohalocapsa sp. TaxID=768990 RepID=UPI0025FA5D32|nr:Rpn family recombination-promoting nuclease/putative transposase [uncultured Thiohalocapsa sp.]
MNALLDPTNDYVFKRLFAEAPELLVALINDLRPDLPDIASVEILNPTIEPNDLTGKYIILDVLARDGDGHCYNVEIQVRRYGAWHKRGLFYLARTLGGQLGGGEDYQELRASVGLHLLDFDLFTASEGERRQAVWRFEMRDEHQPSVTLGNILQMTLIELKKADRLGLPPSPLGAWITFFKHWQETLTMATVTHEPVKQAMQRIRALSADEEARRLAFVRERALRDEVSFLNEAKREGREEGLEKGREEGLEKGLEKGRAESREEIARTLITMNLLTDAQIATASGLSEAHIKALREPPVA